MSRQPPSTAARANARPSFGTLSEAAARALLARQHVGRVAYSFRDRVGIEPIHYVAEGNWIYGRTSAGAKLSTLAHHPWCAFEVDEVRGLFDWESVVVQGTFYLLDPETSTPDAAARALARLRDLVPETLLDGDPAPHRTVVFGIAINAITGRVARSAAADAGG